MVRTDEWEPVVFDGLDCDDHSLKDAAVAVCMALQERIFPEEMALQTFGAFQFISGSSLSFLKYKMLVSWGVDSFQNISGKNQSSQLLIKLVAVVFQGPGCNQLLLLMPMSQNKLMLGLAGIGSC